MMNNGGSWQLDAATLCFPPRASGPLAKQQKRNRRKHLATWYETIAPKGFPWHLFQVLQGHVWGKHTCLRRAALGPLFLTVGSKFLAVGCPNATRCHSLWGYTSSWFFNFTMLQVLFSNFWSNIFWIWTQMNAARAKNNERNNIYIYIYV